MKTYKVCFCSKFGKTDHFFNINVHKQISIVKNLFLQNVKKNIYKSSTGGLLTQFLNKRVEILINFVFENYR